MTPIRSANRTSYPALITFGIVYIATLAIVFTPQSLRACAGGHGTPAIITKGAP